MTTAEKNPLEKLRYPIGPFVWGKKHPDAEVAELITRIEKFPARLKKKVSRMKAKELDTPYRPGGWTVRQVVHHLFDSHANAYIRFKLALTEDSPAIKPYKEELWAELPDSKTLSPSVSLDLLTHLHKRWSVVLKNMKPSDFDRRYFHPEHNNSFPLREILANYAWHGDHHYAHIEQAVPSKKSAERKVTSKKNFSKKSSGRKR